MSQDDAYFHIYQNDPWVSYKMIFISHWMTTRRAQYVKIGKNESSLRKGCQNFYFHFLFLFVWLRLWISWNTEQKPFLFKKWVRSSWSFRYTEKNHTFVCRTNILHHFLFQRMSAHVEVRGYKSEDHAEVRRIFKEGMHENWWPAYRLKPTTQNLTLSNFKHHRFEGG